MASFILLGMAEVNKFLKQKVGEINVLDGALIGASKIASEQLLAQVPFIGNGTFRSGLIKGTTALVVSSATKNKGFRIVTTGMLIDGMEDLAISVKRYLTGKSMTNGQDQDVVVF